MDLSVVIVSYNVASFLDQVLVTLKESMEGIAAEVFVVDNASSDGSVDVVRRKHSWAKLIEAGSNLGFARANNLAMQKASGRYLLLLNPDTVLRRDTLRTMIRFLDEHPETGIAGCKVLNPDGSLQLACRRGFPTPLGAFGKMTGLSTLFPKSRTFGAYNLTWLDPDASAEVDAVSGSFMFVRREVVEGIGFLDERFFMYGEDLDFCYRAKEAGWQIHYVPDTEIIHFKGESSKTVPAIKNIRDFHRAMRIFVDKHHTSRRFVPTWILGAGITFNMAAVLTVNMLIRFSQPLIDLFLLNVSFILSIIMRYGLTLEHAPAYPRGEWAVVFLVYSVLYMGTFVFIGLYHRYRNSPERAVIGVTAAFLLHVLIINFFKTYNFSRIATFYCFGFNAILISGWRFARELLLKRGADGAGKSTLVVGALADAVRLRDLLATAENRRFDVIGCIETSPDVIRGAEREGVHVLGLLGDLGDTVRRYGVSTVIMVGAEVPFSRILSNGIGRGIVRPEVKFVPELPALDTVEKENMGPVTIIDIQSTGTFGA